MSWIKVSERLPEKAGAYRVKRRTYGRRNPPWEDECQYTPPAEIIPGMTVRAGRWQNARGVVMNSVVEWWEEDGKYGQGPVDA